MKKQIRNVAVIVMLASLATACQKETVLPLSEGDDANYAVNEEVKKTVNYTVDGVGQSVTLAGDDAWQEFLYRMLDMAEMGYDIRIFREDNSSRMATNKEVVVYTTADKNEAAAWCTTMYNNGYVVSMYYALTQYGHGSVTVSGGTLSAGMYVYSLVVDGQIVDTKQMILTK